MNRSKTTPHTRPLRDAEFYELTGAELNEVSGGSKSEENMAKKAVLRKAQEALESMR